MSLFQALFGRPSESEKPPISPPPYVYPHRGFLLTSGETGKVAEVIEAFCNMWRETCKKANVAPPHSNIIPSYNGHESAAIFPAGGRELGMLYLEEQIVHTNLQRLLLEDYPEVQWVHVYYDADGASIINHTKG